MAITIKGKVNPQKVVVKRYRWVDGSQMSGSADRAMQELLKIMQARGNQFKPADVVPYARNPKNYLHRYITPNIRRAAEKQWISEVQKLIRSIEVDIQIGKGKVVTVKAIPSIPDEHLRDSVDSYYTPVEDAVADKVAMGRLHSKALADLRAWRNRYSMISSLTPLFNAINKFLGTP